MDSNDVSIRDSIAVVVKHLVSVSTQGISSMDSQSARHRFHQSLELLGGRHPVEHEIHGLACIRLAEKERHELVKIEVGRHPRLLVQRITVEDDHVVFQTSPDFGNPSLPFLALEWKNECPHMHALPAARERRNLPSPRGI